MTCFQVSSGLAFVDCGVIFRDAAQFRREMEKKFHKETSHLLLTHTHWDHCFAMKAFEDCTIITSQKGFNSLKTMKTRRKDGNIRVPQHMTADPDLKEAMETAELLIPQVSVKDTFSMGDHQELMFCSTGGHSPDSAFIYSPSERTLCAGDNLLTCYAQLVGNGKKMLEIYHRWESMDIQQVIPGHGRVVGKEYITCVRTYFEALIGALRELKQKGYSLEEVMTHPRLPDYFGTQQPEWIENSPYHEGWLNLGISYWYKNV
jgi:glyoxylase-like metal-dependent hydrolase (beta-lactamase superfamily II)